MAAKLRQRETVVPPLDAARLRRRLLAWYDRAARDLPWRRRADDPYAQWLAEMMLQQTRTETVQRYYEPFLTRFPTVRTLADAPLDAVLERWAGLGYYARARNLHRAAREIVERFGGRVPRTVDELLTLPGVGRYTAGAVASIAFGARAPILDGNVARVLTRICAIEGSPADTAVREQLWHCAEQILPRARCGDFNQALMDLGATVCTSRAPRCADCPLQALCLARAAGREQELPARSRRAAVQQMTVAVLGVSCGKRLLMRKRPAEGLWGGLWEVPGEVAPSPHDVLDRLVPPALLRQLQPLEFVGRLDQLLTHRRVRFEVFQSRPTSRALVSVPAPYRWVRFDEFGGLALSRAQWRILALLD